MVFYLLEKQRGWISIIRDQVYTTSDDNNTSCLLTAASVSLVVVVCLTIICSTYCLSAAHLLGTSVCSSRWIPCPRRLPPSNRISPSNHRICPYRISTLTTDLPSLIVICLAIGVLTTTSSSTRILLANSSIWLRLVATRLRSSNSYLIVILIPSWHIPTSTTNRISTTTNRVPSQRILKINI